MSTQLIDRPYSPLRFKPPRHNAAASRLAACEWLNYLSGKKLSISKWTKEIGIKFSFENKEIPVNFNDIYNHIMENCGVDLSKFGVPAHLHKVPWADKSIQFSQDHIIINANNPTDTIKISILADLVEFPLRVAIDREGFSVAPMHVYLYENILNSRRFLVENSHKMLSHDSLWIQNFFTYFNSYVSLVESALVQIYYKAKYEASEAGLIFNPEKMGSTITGRVAEKFDWIFHSTGKHLDDASLEIKNFNKIKGIRNHLNHFDPPLFGCTAEDVRDWLNLTGSLGELIWKIRRKLRLPPSKAMLSLVFAPEVEFVPKDPSLKRIAQGPNVGYACCERWTIPAPQTPQTDQKFSLSIPMEHLRVLQNEANRKMNGDSKVEVADVIRELIKKFADEQSQ